MKLLIKIGGTLVDKEDYRRQLAEQIANATLAGHSVAVVHGGGRQLTGFLEERGVESRFVNGLRITSDEAISAVVTVLAGSVNKQLVAALRAARLAPVGICGIDGRLTTAVRMSEELGWVGRVTRVRPELLDLLVNAGYVPVVACVAGDDEGRAWNINADQMASACALAFRADKLIFLTDVEGVLGQTGDVIPGLTLDAAAKLMADGIARGGMRAKLEAAVAAVRGGVPKVAIAGGADPRVIERILDEQPAGTAIYHAAGVSGSTGIIAEVTAGVIE